jgi:GH24 family phage-related lysozyme (muramidase)
VNELQFTNAYGLRLIQEFEGEPRLAARLCEGGRYELGYGITFDLDGQPFTATSTCTPDYADALFRNALKFFEDGVRRLVTVPLNSNQFSGLVALAWNIGLENFRSSTVLRRVNEGRMEDAAASFGMWVFATKGGHKQALRGLLRRRYSEAALFLGYSWTEACDNDAIALQREIPASLPGTDRVIYKTAFKDVLAVAQRYPLPPLDDELVLSTPIKAEPAVVPIASKAGQPVPLPGPAPAAPALEKPALSGPASATAPPVKVPAPQRAPEGTKPPDPPVPIGQQTSAVDGAKRSEEWSSGTKAMWQSRRFYGLVLIMAGRLWMLKTGSNAFLGAVSDPLVMEFVGGFGVMIAGELIQSWGRAKAKKALH